MSGVKNGISHSIEKLFSPEACHRDQIGPNVDKYILSIPDIIYYRGLLIKFGGLELQHVGICLHEECRENRLNLGFNGSVLE
jgi:hypothetical protein